MDSYIDKVPHRPMQTRRPSSRPRIGKWGERGLMPREVLPEQQSFGHCTDEPCRYDEGLGVCSGLEICHRTIRERHRRGAPGSTSTRPLPHPGRECGSATSSAGGSMEQKPSGIWGTHCITICIPPPPPPRRCISCSSNATDLH